MSEDAICVGDNRGPLLPLFDGENDWPRGLRIVLYFVGLFWCFMGVSIIADVFMTAIERVTSKKVRRYDTQKKRWYTFEVWNPTVANLTLMALGSSAPEILLNVIDIFAKEFFLEGLGPSTIVGSAAFNLLIIIAVCILAIPGGQVRQIKDMSVYTCTASWSIFAYLWLIVILVLITPDVVEIWEGVLTFLFFPMLVFMAFACDKGWVGSGQSGTSRVLIHEDMTAEEVAEAYSMVIGRHGQNLTDDQIARIMTAMNERTASRAKYRVNATRSLLGGKRLKMAFSKNMGNGNSSKVAPIEEDTPAVTFYLPVTKFAVLENAGEISITVCRNGDFSLRAEVYYQTANGTGVSGTDFHATEGWLIFEPDEIEKTVQVTIIDDKECEQDEVFYLRITEARTATGEVAEVAKEYHEAAITIIDDDDAGVLSFATDEDKDQISISQQNSAFMALFRVQRRQGSCGKITVKYHTESDTAIPGRDYESVEGELTLVDKQMEATIEVPIKYVPRYDNSDRFRVFLSDPTGGAMLDHRRDGGPDRQILTVSIEADGNTKESIDRVRSLLRTKWDKSKVGHSHWWAQFREALLVNGGDDDGEDDDEDDNSEGPKPSPSIQDYIAHFITLPWKLLFAFVPPTDYCGGWLCFGCALLAIGLVTMLINDMASLLGCVLCIPDDITAITFVALGTSLPDTFASMSAATSEPCADSSVGNVTGSNSVNVFLGLGLPWMIASVAWAVSGPSQKWRDKYQYADGLDALGVKGLRKQVFVVPAGSLGFSVGVFSACAVLCIALLAWRRRVVGGELGGNRKIAVASSVALVVLWLIYIAASAVKSLEIAGSSCPS